MILDGRCDACGQEIPSDEQTRHEDGIDALRPECPVQDIEAIKREQQPDPWTRFLRNG